MGALKEAELALEAKDEDAFCNAISTIEDETTLVPLYSKLLLEDWHEMHEDIVFDLGLIGDPRPVESILKAATIPFGYLVEWGNLQAFQRKCAYALARIATEESKEALKIFSQHSDPYIQEYGKEGLEKWPLLQN
jgi:hypothetical protein